MVAHHTTQIPMSVRRTGIKSNSWYFVHAFTHPNSTPLHLYIITPFAFPFSSPTSLFFLYARLELCGGVRSQRGEMKNTPVSFLAIWLWRWEW